MAPDARRSTRRGEWHPAPGHPRTGAYGKVLCGSVKPVRWVAGAGAFSRLIVGVVPVVVAVSVRFAQKAVGMVADADFA